MARQVRTLGMGEKILFNRKTSNHLVRLKEMSESADTFIIVSPFLSDDIAGILEHMPTIRRITLYTTLDKYDDTVQKSVALFDFYWWCGEHDIDLIININDNLHGKAYLFYKGEEEKGFVITSGNFTQNGLEHNIEFGIAIEDVGNQKEIAKEIMSMPCYELGETELYALHDAALAYKGNYPETEKDTFKAKKIIDKKPKKNQAGVRNFYIKPVGTTKTPFVKPSIVEDNHEIGFNNDPKFLHRGDILFCHGVGTGYIVGYYMASDEDAFYHKLDDGDRWPWKIHIECQSGKFSSHWWDFNLKTQNLVEKFLSENPGKHITSTGKDSLGALQWGKDRLHITEEFGRFIIDEIEKAQE